MLALLSVSDKRGLPELGRELCRLGFSLLSTGGTLEALRREGVPARMVSEHTGSPEILGGRVKTLHPRIHGGLLADLDLPGHRQELERQGIQPISLLAVNLYPFREAVERGASFAEAVEQIDVGGPAMVRAAAKNAAHVTVMVDPDDYPAVLQELSRAGAVSAATRRRLMQKAFAHTAAYDAAIARYLQGQQEEPGKDPFPEELTLPFQRARVLRHGENPHQRAALYRDAPSRCSPALAFASVLQGKELSYNNLLDLESALQLALEFPESPCAVVVKHGTPCGVAISPSLEQAYRTARAADEVSAFGGVVALSREVEEATAAALGETFLEAVIAPCFSPRARELLAAKKNLRLLETSGPFERRGAPQVELRSISGGLLLQDRDEREPAVEWKVVTRRAPSGEELAQLRFAWRVCKWVKSNAIVFSTSDRLVAAGGGQTSRVDAVRIAAARGGERLRGTACASDAFFPFRDGLDEVARAGARCVAQPGGSVRDAEVIAAADEHGLAMVLTSVRHFRH